MKNRTISNNQLCSKFFSVFPTQQQQKTRQIVVCHASVWLHLNRILFQMGSVCSAIVNCISNGTATDNAIFIVHVDDSLDRSLSCLQLNDFSCVLCKNYNIFDGVNQFLPFEQTHTPHYCYANCTRLAIPFIIAFIPLRGTVTLGRRQIKNPSTIT